MRVLLIFAELGMVRWTVLSSVACPCVLEYKEGLLVLLMTAQVDEHDHFLTSFFTISSQARRSGQAKGTLPDPIMDTDLQYSAQPDRENTGAKAASQTMQTLTKTHNPKSYWLRARSLAGTS